MSKKLFSICILGAALITVAIFTSSETFAQEPSKMTVPGSSSTKSDIFVGRRGSIKRYLICPMEGYFPVIARTGPKSIAAIFRTGGTHMGISATVAVSTSSDGGKSWSDPVEITPRWEDSRNPALGVNAKGELIAAFWKAGLHYYSKDQNGNMVWDESGWEKTGSVDAVFCCKSSDGGKTWSKPKAIKSALLFWACPYGRILTAPDGTLLMSMYGHLREDVDKGKWTTLRDCEWAVILTRSKDGGDTWGDETLVARGFNETAFALLPDGGMIAAARCEKGRYVAVAHSSDAGRTWGEPKQITCDEEHPADLCVLKSGRVLMTFGRRIPPMGCGALVSSDGGKTWDFDHEVLLAGDSPNSTDCGYPSTVQLDDGNIVTAMYFAGGSMMSAQKNGRPWGQCSCQALHYREEDICR